MSMRVHRNLLWIRADEERMNLLVADPTIRRHMVARPAPDLIAFMPRSRQTVVKRLEQLGHSPREVLR